MNGRNSEHESVLSPDTYDILTPLDICVDLILTGGDVVPEFNQKEKLVEDYTVEMGGSCCIFACQAAKLGLKTVGVGTVGAESNNPDSFGRIVLNRLTEAGVDTGYIKRDLREKTGLGVALALKDDRAILTYLGTIDKVTKDHFPNELLKRVRHLHIGSYYLFNRLRPSLPDIVSTAKELGVTVSLDPNWDPEEGWNGGLREIIRRSDIFFPNENELQAITGETDIRKAFDALQNDNLTLVVKRGTSGATVLQKNSSLSIEAPQVAVADTVGAGDSFDAGFLYGYLHGCNTERSLQIAVTCGSASTTKHGGFLGQITGDQLGRKE